MSEVKSYTYKKFMRDGSVREITAVVRQRSKPGKTVRDHGKKGKHSDRQESN